MIIRVAVRIIVVPIKAIITNIQDIKETLIVRLTQTTLQEVISAPNIELPSPSRDIFPHQ